MLERPTFIFTWLGRLFDCDENKARGESPSVTSPAPTLCAKHIRTSALLRAHTSSIAFPVFQSKFCFTEGEKIQISACRCRDVRYQSLEVNFYHIGLPTFLLFQGCWCGMWPTFGIHHWVIRLVVAHFYRSNASTNYFLSWTFAAQPCTAQGSSAKKYCCWATGLPCRVVSTGANLTWHKYRNCPNFHLKLRSYAAGTPCLPRSNEYQKQERSSSQDATMQGFYLDGL